MPNYCNNKADISLYDFDNQNADDVAFIEALANAFNTGTPLSFICPVKDLKESTARDSWGTKWEAQNIECYPDNHTGFIYVYFDTAWSPPTEAFVNAIKRGGLWSRLNVHMLSAEPSDFFAESFISASETIVHTFETPIKSFNGMSDELVDFVKDFLFDDEN